MGVLDKLAGATTGTVTVDLILDAALEAEWDLLHRQLEGAYNDDVNLVDDDGNGESLAMPATTRVVNRMEEIRDQVAASKVTFEFKPMDWPDRLALEVDHPPRLDNLVDASRGYDVTTFIPAMIRATCVKVTDAAGDESTDIPRETWDHLLGDPTADPPVKPALTYGQISRLFGAAQRTDTGVTRVPPSARYLLGAQDSGASLAQPSPGTSPLDGSEDGSPRGSRKSSTAKKAPRKKAGLSAS